jgi:hypothetical protein
MNLGYAHWWDLSFFAGSIRKNIMSRIGVKEKEGATVKIDTSNNGENLQPYSNGMNYAEDRNWMRRDTKEGATIDVFVIEPTAIFDQQKTLFVDPYDDALETARKLFDAASVDSIFEGLPVNIYVPRYRQANGDYILNLEKQGAIFWNDKTGPTIPAQDIFNAFAYYLQKYNNGNQVVLVSHSQGSVIGKYLVTEFIPRALSAEQQKAVKLYYMFGFGLTDEILAKSPYPASTSPLDTGTIISWNTATPAEVKGKLRATWGDATTHAVNPITFDTRTDHVPASDNPESVWNLGAKVSDTKKIPHMTGAQLVKDSAGGWVVQLDFEAEQYLTDEQIAAQDAYNIGYTHRNDASLFAETIRANFIQRMKLE